MLTARLNRLNLKPGHKVLDLGCGEGRHVHGLHMIGGLTAIGLDLSEKDVKTAREGLKVIGEAPRDGGATAFLSGDALALPFADDTFDAVIISEVLEHLPDWEGAVAEIRRVLRPGGRLCATVPHAWPERICWKLAPPPDGYPLTPGGHLRIFNDKELRRAIKSHGFKPTSRHHAHALHAPYWWLKCLFWDKENWLVRAYHKMLVLELMQRPLLFRVFERLFAPLMGKSVALYFTAEDKT